MKTTAHKNQKGFTLIELLVVIGILAVLLAIVLIAINPARQFSQANDTKRRSDLNAILNAIHQYGADKRGNLNALNLTTAPQYISNDVSIDHTDTFNADPALGIGLCQKLVPTYIAALPTDPTLGQLGSTDSDGAPVTDCSVTFDTGYIASLVDSATSRVAVSGSGELDTDGDGSLADEIIQILR